MNTVSRSRGYIPTVEGTVDAVKIPIKDRGFSLKAHNLIRGAKSIISDRPDLMVELLNQ